MALRHDIAGIVRALPDEELLALVSHKLADLVTPHGALAPVASEEKSARWSHCDAALGWTGARHWRRWRL